MLDRSWGVLAIYSILMCISMSLPIFGGSIVNTAMARTLGWDATSLGLLVVANMTAASLLLPMAAKLIGRFGVRPSMVGGFLSMALGAVALVSVAHRPGSAILAYGIAMGVTSAFSGVIQCQTAVASLFPTRRTLAFSLLYAGTGIVSFGLLSAISYGMSVIGRWQTGWYIFLACAVAGILLSLFVVKEPAALSHAGVPHDGELGVRASQTAVFPDRTFGQALQMPLFWIIALSMIGITAGSIFLAAHAQVYLFGRGFTAPQAALSVSLLQIGMILGNLGLGIVASRVELRRAMGLALLSFAFSFVLLANVHSWPALVAFAILAGIGYGGGQVGCMALIGHYWEQKIFPMLTATGLIVQTIGSAAVPVLAGSYYDRHGSYLPPIYLMAAFYLLIGAAIVIAGRTRGAGRATRVAGTTAS